MENVKTCLKLCNVCENDLSIISLIATSLSPVIADSHKVSLGNPPVFKNIREIIIQIILIL
jgi:hypothetical protein